MCDTTKFTRSGGVTSSTYASECYLALQNGKVTSTSSLGSFQSFVLRYWDYSMGTPLRIKVDGNIIATLSTNAYGCGDGGCKKAWTSPVFTYGVHTIEINDTAYSEYGAQIITVALFGQAATPTPTDTATPTITLTLTDGATPTLSGSETATPTATETATPTTSLTYGPTPTLTAIPTEEAPEPLQSAKYLYDGDGNLVKSVVNSVMGNTTTTYYPGKHYTVEEKSGAMKVQKHYAAGSTVIAVRTVTAEADTLQWMISDHLGSTSTTANADGTWNSDIRYTAFGEIRLKTGVTATGYRYTGQLDMQGSIGLDYFVARFYDPQLARFAQADSIIPNAGSIKSFDHYAYVNNNPIIYNDPTGHDVGCAGRDASACDSMNHLRPSSWWEAALNWGKTTLDYYFVNVVYPQNKAVAQVVRNSFTILPLLQTPVISQALGNWMGVGNGQAPGPIAPIVPVNQTQMIQSLLQYDRTQLTGQGLEVLTGDPAVTAINNNIRQFTENDPRYGKENFSYKYTTEGDNFNNPMPGNQIVFGGSDRGSAFSQPGTWEVRNASYSAQVDVTKNGVITVNYQIEDIFDLRPGGRGLVYDAIGAVAAPIYHDFLGGNPNMKTIVNWVWVYTP